MVEIKLLHHIIITKTIVIFFMIFIMIMIIIIKWKLGTLEPCRFYSASRGSWKSPMQRVHELWTVDVW